MEQTVENSGGSEGEGPEKGNSRRKSKVWNHFSKDGTAATCNYCQQRLSGVTTNGTSHLRRHYESCKGKGDRPRKRPRESPPVRPASNQGEPSVLLLDASNKNLPGESSSPTRPAPSSSINQEECVAKLAEMIAFHGYPSSIVEDDCFSSFVSGLNPEFQMPSRAAVEATCRQRAQDAKTLLLETLACCPGNISLALGTVETDQGKALYMACQFIDEEWNLQKRILETFKVVPFPPYHPGALLGNKELSIDEPSEETLAQIKFPKMAWASSLVEEAACSWGLSGRLFSVVKGQELYTTTYFLRALGPDEIMQNYMRRVNYITYCSDVMSSAADKIFSMLCPYYVDACLKAVKCLNLDLKKRARYFSELGLNHVGRYDKRWYSYYCALEVLHKEEFTGNFHFGPSVRNDNEVFKRQRQIELFQLPKFKENQFTELLRKILGVAYRAIQRISSSMWPTSNLCIEELMKLRQVLQSEADACKDATKAVAYAKVCGFRDGKDVDTVLLHARDVLDMFLKDSFECLTIPAVLDPRYNLDYVTNIFNQVFGTEASAKIFWVQESIKDIFIAYQRKLCNGVHAEGNSSMAAGTSTATMDMDANTPDLSIKEVEGQLTDVYVSKIFKEVYSTEDPSYISMVRETIENIVKQDRKERWLNDKATELERYLADDDDVIPPEKREGFDVLIWWKENSHKYPTVARMARDFLAMPSSDVLSPEHLALIKSMTSSYGAVYPESVYSHESGSEWSDFESE